MQLSPGSRLGPYEISALVGEGGMGRVYRARDTRLGRDVAIKVVLEPFIADRERLARFEREARALAALNHPNIATLHGMEEVEGRHFLVMELVDGQTLAEVLGAAVGLARTGSVARQRSSVLSLERVLSIALQIAEALEGAHEKGIIHRDLKPANVKITPDDKVKVLDFGLAKAADADPKSSSTSLANSPTITAMGTQAGLILGTASYMSPEQARGLSGDHRSDVFSFGVVLYEMLTGCQPFQGETVSDVLASVLAREPNLTSLPSDLPPRLSELVKRCLEKHPRQRWQAMGDVRHELEVIAKNPRKVADSADAVALAASALAPQPFWRRATPVTAGALLAAGVTAAAFMATRPPPPLAPPVSRFAIPYPEGQPRTVNVRTAFAISPDGTHVAYVANRDIYIRALSDLEPRVLARGDVSSLASVPMNLAFSPDGKSLVYFDLGEGNIKRIELAGGGPSTVCAANNPNGITWSGDHLYFTGPGGIRRVLASGGEPEIVIKNDQNLLQTSPQVLEDGRLLYSVAPPGSDNFERWSMAKIVLQRPGDATATTLVEGGSDPRYLASGHLVYHSGGVLMARRFDPQIGTLGSPTPVVEGVLRGSAGFSAGTTWYRVSSTGTLIYVPGPVGSGLPDSRLAWFDRAGKADLLPIPAGPYVHPRVSRDGKRIAFSRVDSKETSIWVYDLDGGASARRLTFGGRDRFPIWSGDSQWVIFLSERGGDAGLYRQRADGSGEAERLTTAAKETLHSPETAAPDGSVLIFSQTALGAAAGATALMAYSFRDRTVAPYRGVTSAFKGGAEFSPNGKWLAYATTAGRQSAIILYVEPYPATGAKHQIVTAREGGHSPVWSADGRELFYTPGPGSVLQSVRITTSPSFSFAPGEPFPRPFSNAPPTTGRMFDVGRSGIRILGLLPAYAADVSSPKRDEIRVVLNWVEELKTRVK